MLTDEAVAAMVALCDGRKEWEPAAARIAIQAFAADRAARIEREAALTSALEKCRHALARITAGMGVVCHPDGRLVVEWHPVLEIATVALTETAAALGVTPRSP